MTIDNSVSFDFTHWKIDEEFDAVHGYKVLFRDCFGNITIVSLRSPEGKETFYDLYTTRFKDEVVKEVNAYLERRGSNPAHQQG